MQKVLAEKARGAEVQRCRLAMNVRQAAAEAGVGHDSIYDGIRSGALEARKLGRRTIITRDALERFIAALPRLELPPAHGPAERQEGPTDGARNS